MKNISVDCDCNGSAEPPCMKDIGILASTDPGKKKVIQRIEEKLGPHIIECSVKLGTGSSNYELINVD